MALPLSEIENAILIEAQLPGANPGGTPVWSAAGLLTQAKCDFAINNYGYKRTMSALAKVGLFLVTDRQPSVANTSDYQLPYGPNTNPKVGMVHRVFYSPATGTFLNNYLADNVASATGLAVTFPFVLTQRPTAGLVSLMSTFMASTTQTIGLISAAGDPSLVTWPASSGSLNATLYVTVGNPNLNLVLVRVRRLDAGANNVLGEVATSGAISTSLTNAGAYTVSLSWAAQAANLTDRIMLQWSIQNTAGTNQPLSWQLGINALSLTATPFAGYQYDREFAGQVMFKSWNDFQIDSGLGVLRPFAYGLRPDSVAISPSRTKMVFMPGSSAAGDLITVQYAPIPTPGAVICPTLVAETDTTVLPDDADQAIVSGAMVLIWKYLRQPDMVKLAEGEFQNHIKEIIQTYGDSSIQDSVHISNVSAFTLDDSMEMGLF